MSRAALRTPQQIELELPDDPRATPLVRRLAAQYWEIVQRTAVRDGFPISRAWLEVDVDADAVTWFPLTVHAQVTHEQAWEFRRSMSTEVDRWIEQLDASEQDVRGLIALAIIGLKRPRRPRNGV